MTGRIGCQGSQAGGGALLLWGMAGRRSFRGDGRRSLQASSSSRSRESAPIRDWTALAGRPHFQPVLRNADHRRQKLHGESTPEWFAPLLNWDFKDSKLLLWLRGGQPPAADPWKRPRWRSRRITTCRIAREYLISICGGARCKLQS